MKLLPLLAVFAASCDLSSGLAPPTTAITSRKTFASATRLSADASAAAAELPRGGESGGTASIPSEVFNLIKSIVGAGVLSLPAGKEKNRVCLSSFVVHRIFSDTDPFPLYRGCRLWKCTKCSYPCNCLDCCYGSYFGIHF